MNSSCLKNLVPGSAEYVVAHARLRHSRGRRPSMRYLHIGDPRKALAAAQMVLDGNRHYQSVEHFMAGYMPTMTPDQVRDLSNRHLEALIRALVSTSSSEEELKRRLQDELGIIGPSIYWRMPVGAVGRQAMELGRALGGLVSASGAMVMIMCWSPIDFEMISM